MWVYHSHQVTAGVVSSVSFTGLDGDTEQMYMLRYNVLTDGSYIEFGVRPNGLATNSYSYYTEGLNGSVRTRTDHGLKFAANIGASWAQGEVIIHASRYPGGSSVARGRHMYSRVTGYKSATGGSDLSSIGYGTWNETATNITSLDFCTTPWGNAALSSDIGLESVIALYKLEGYA